MFGKFGLEKKVRRVLQRAASEMKISEKGLLSRWDFDKQIAPHSLRDDLYRKYKAYRPSDNELLCMLIEYGYFDNELEKHGDAKISEAQRHIFQWCAQGEIRVLNGVAVANNLGLRFQGREAEMIDPFP